MIESSSMIGFAERDLPSDTQRAGHDPGQAGPRPGLAATPSVATARGWSKVQGPKYSPFKPENQFISDVKTR